MELTAYCDVESSLHTGGPFAHSHDHTRPRPRGDAETRSGRGWYLVLDIEPSTCTGRPFIHSHDREVAYERSLCLELTAEGIAYERQISIPVIYKGEVVAAHRPDLVVAGLVVVEVKSVERLTRVHTAQMLTYLRVTGREFGLLLNFNEAVLKSGIRRVVLQGGARTL